MLGLTPASKVVRSSAPLAGQLHISHIYQTWHHLPFVWAPQRKFRMRHFSSDEEVKTAVRKWLKMHPVEFYNKGICALRGAPSPPKKGADRISTFFQTWGGKAPPHTPRLFLITAYFSKLYERARCFAPSQRLPSSRLAKLLMAAFFSADFSSLSKSQVVLPIILVLF